MAHLQKYDLFLGNLGVTALTTKVLAQFQVLNGTQFLNQEVW
jgi:hypothetical protein